MLFTNVIDPDFHISVDCYPQALPNDGRSAAEISVVLRSGEEPVADSVILAEVITGDGSLTYHEAVTDETGVARFPFISGVMTEATALNFRLADQEEVAANLCIPFAPVAYLDVQLVTPEEYADYLKRQVSAAPIYQLSTSVFPDQLAADGGSMSSVTARLSHVDGKPAAGVPLLAEIISGEGSLDVDQIATDSNGEFKFYFIADYTPGTVSIAVTEPSTGLIATADILLVEAGPARVNLFYTDPIADGLALEGALLPADGISGLPVIAEVTDLSGIPLAGVDLNISLLDESNGWIEVLDTVSDIAGRVEFIYHAGTATGSVRLRAYIAGGVPSGDGFMDGFATFD